MDIVGAVIGLVALAPLAAAVAITIKLDSAGPIGTFKLSTDPRVTKVGRLLRRTSIDEMPQLGDMSLVGPRALVIPEDELVEGRHRDRLHLAPGIPAAGQVPGPVRLPLSEMIKTDYLYAIS